MKQRFDELLPWYANGTLGAEDRAWVERYLEQHPQSRAELDWYGALQMRLHESAPAVPETLGLDKAMALIRGNRPTLAQRMSATFARLGLQPAAAFAGVAIFAVQGVAIVGLMSAARNDASEIRSLRGSAVDDGPMLKLNFSPEATEAEMRHLLVSVQGRLAGGPGQLGDYFVVVARGKEGAMVEQLKASPIVAAVTLVPGLPPRD